MKTYEFENDEPRPKRYRGCADRFCGADDCPNCRPENFRSGVYVDDIKEDEFTERVEGIT